MSIYQTDLFSAKTKLDQTLERLRFHCAGKKVLCAFSGGKDSQACYHLCLDAGLDVHPQYSITRFEPPELIPFIREHYPQCEIRRPYKMSLVNEIAYRGLPNMWFRWCCNSKHLKTDGYDITVIGVRSSESVRRAKVWRSFGRRSDGVWYVCPIFDWTEDEVWEYLNSKNLPHCKLYDQGLHRIGCACCPLVHRTLREQARRWPKIANMLYIGLRKHWERIVDLGGVSRTGKPYKVLEHGSARAAFEYWLDHGNMLKRAPTKDEEPCLFAGTGFSDGDSPLEELGEDI